MKRRKNIVKRLLALGMVAAILTGCGNSGSTESSVKSQDTASSVQSQEEASTEQAEESIYPDYLNLDGYRPIVNEGEEITITMMILRSSGSQMPAEDTWFYNFIEEKLNINLEVEVVTSENVSERKSLMMMSGDMPDIMANLGFSTGDVMKYGVEEELFLPISDYFDETLTPNLVATLDEFEDAKIASTAPNNKIYTMPAISAVKPGYGSSLPMDRVFIDTKYLEAAGITEVPDTLDGFVDMLRTFKEMDPEVMGVSEIWPLVGCDGLERSIFANAFVWAMKTGESFVDPMWDVETEEIVIPAFQEKYGEYLKLMNTLYTEGLLHPDYYTMDGTAARALMTERKTPVIADWAPYLSQPDNWSEYVGVAALKSEWCEEGISTRSLDYSRGDFYISADTEYPELCVRLLDYLYSDEGSVYAIFGAYAGDDTLDMIPGMQYVIKDGVEEFQMDPENFEEEWGDKYETSYQWRTDYIQLFSQSYFNEDKIDRCIVEHFGYEYEVPELSLQSRDNHYRLMVMEAAGDHLVSPLPVSYMSSDNLERYSDLRTVIKNHVDVETAKFVVGQRPLSELDDFFEELKAIGSEEYAELVLTPYENYTRPEE